ncbi:MAG TPA: hypothetical protein VHA56_13405 [Mucilaginibacter sp.]|nr:hypothetical protein [Mucilaginibacter sp.]
MRNKSQSKIKGKFVFISILAIGLSLFVGKTSAQTTPPQGPPPPPPPPSEVFKKINPFKKKKHKSDTVKAPAPPDSPEVKPATRPAGPPPPVPNPLDLFRKKKKKDTTHAAPLPKHHG